MSALDAVPKRGTNGRAGSGADDRNRLIRHTERSVLENAAYERGVAPTRIFALLLPVWCVEVKATIVDAEPYALIDRYLERGIVDADLRTTGDLARFFALDESLVDRALRFLEGIGHVRRSAGQLALTPLAEQSLRDDVRYTRTVADRRNLYFDGYGSRPLTRPYYDSRTVTFLSGRELVQPTTQGWPRFWMLATTRGFRRESLAELIRNPDRHRFNLPARIESLESLEQTCVYLPMYVVRGVEPQGNVRYLAYTQTGHTPDPDPDISELCEQTDEINSAIQAEDVRRGRRFGEDQLRRWLGAGDDEPMSVEIVAGAIRVTFPATSFEGETPRPISSVGSYLLRNQDVVEVWCPDEAVRRQALLARADSYLNSFDDADPDHGRRWLQQVSRRLQLEHLGIGDLRRMATGSGRQALAEQLDRLQ